VSNKFSSVTSYDIAVVTQTTANTPLHTEPAPQCVPQYPTLTIHRPHTHECFWFRKPESILQLQLHPGFSLNGAKYRLTVGVTQYWGCGRSEQFREVVMWVRLLKACSAHSFHTDNSKKLETNDRQRS
jgi:hypothetical protein